MNLCRKGLHDLNDPANVKDTKKGRQCRPCVVAANRRYTARKRDAEGYVREPMPADASACATEGCDRPLHHTNAGRLRHCLAHYCRLLKYGEEYADVPVEHQGWKSLPQRREARELAK